MSICAVLMPRVHQAGMPLSGRPPHTVPEEDRLVGYRAVRLERDNEMGRDRRSQHVLSVAAGAIEVVVLPPLIGLGVHGIERRGVVGIAKRRLGRRGVGADAVLSVVALPGGVPPPPLVVLVLSGAAAAVVSGALAVVVLVESPEERETIQAFRRRSRRAVRQ